MGPHQKEDAQQKFTMVGKPNSVFSGVQIAGALPTSCPLTLRGDEQTVFNRLLHFLLFAVHLHAASELVLPIISHQHLFTTLDHCGAAIVNGMSPHHWFDSQRTSTFHVYTVINVWIVNRRADRHRSETEISGEAGPILPKVLDVRGKQMGFTQILDTDGLVDHA
jgi:hypothetical protein